MKSLNKLVFLSLTILLFLSSCGTNSQGNSYTIGGQISGLTPNNTIILGLNGISQIFTLNGTYSFSNKIPQNESYIVSIVTQPTGEACSFATNNNSANTLTSNITDINITCSVTQVKISGNITDSEMA